MTTILSRLQKVHKDQLQLAERKERAKRELLDIINEVLLRPEELPSLFKNIPFWIIDSKQHERLKKATKQKCCFNHIIGLPKKGLEEKELFPYELDILKILDQWIALPADSEQNKMLWIKKATGLGITEFFIRYMAWLCLSSNRFRHTKMVIVVGPRLDLATTLIDRIKDLFNQDGHLSVNFPDTRTEIILNSVHIGAYPSYKPNTFRGLANVSFVLVDEGDFFPKNEQQNVRDVVERYIGKSNPIIAMVSTPNAPGGLFETIEKDKDSPYHKIFLPYTVGLGYIYTDNDIKKARRQPGFEREYNLKYLGKVGNLFTYDKIESIIKKYKDKGLDKLELVNKFTTKSMGIDPSYGSSKFGIVITELLDDNIIRVVYAKEYDRPDFSDMVNLCFDLDRKYNVTNTYVDGSNPAFIKAFKRMINEDPDYEQLEESDATDPFQYHIIPVPFNREGKGMLSHLKNLVDNEILLVNSDEFKEVVIALKTASAKEFHLDKNATSYDDLLDALRMAVKHFKYEREDSAEEEEEERVQSYSSIVIADFLSFH